MAVNKNVKSIPESFTNIEDAGAFWDTHSLSDHEDQTKPVDCRFDITKSTRYISIPETIYKEISRKAKAKHLSVRNMVYSLGK